MAKLPRRFLVHTAQVERKTTGGFHRGGYGDAVPVKCLASHKRRRIRGADGYEIVNETTLVAALKDADKFEPGDHVTVLGKTVTVDEVNRADAPGLGVPEHVLVVCS